MGNWLANQSSSSIGYMRIPMMLEKLDLLDGMLLSTRQAHKTHQHHLLIVSKSTRYALLPTYDDSVLSLARQAFAWPHTDIQKVCIMQD